MFAALNAAERGCEVHLFEKNETRPTNTEVINALVGSVIKES